MGKLKIVGLIVSAVGALASIVGGMVDDAKMKEAVDEAVTKRLAEENEETNETGEEES